MVRNVQDELNRSMPAAQHAALGDLLAALIVNYNALQADVVAGHTGGAVVAVPLPLLGAWPTPDV
jgi:hypothetical protein